MILEFHFVGDRERMRASVPELDMLEELPGIAAINTRSRQIVAVGETGEEIRAKAPAYWDRHGKDIAVIHPFDLVTLEPAVGEHKAVVAARLVSWFAGHAAARWKRQGLWRQISGPWVDSIDYYLDLPGYRDLGTDRRKDLVRILRKMLPSVHRLYVNNERVAGRWG